MNKADRTRELLLNNIKSLNEEREIIGNINKIKGSGHKRIKIENNENEINENKNEEEENSINDNNENNENNENVIIDNYRLIEPPPFIENEENEEKTENNENDNNENNENEENENVISENEESSDE